MHHSWFKAVPPARRIPVAHSVRDLSACPPHREAFGTLIVSLIPPTSQVSDGEKKATESLLCGKQWEARGLDIHFLEI